MYRVALLLCPRTPHLYHTQTVYPPRHSVTSSALRDKIKGTSELDTPSAHGTVFLKPYSLKRGKDLRLAGIFQWAHVMIFGPCSDVEFVK
jgi:hypothetical protein